MQKGTMSKEARPAPEDSAATAGSGIGDTKPAREVTWKRVCVAMRKASRGLRDMPGWCPGDWTPHWARSPVQIEMKKKIFKFFFLRDRFQDVELQLGLFERLERELWSLPKENKLKKTTIESLKENVPSRWLARATAFWPNVPARSGST